MRRTSSSDKFSEDIFVIGGPICTPGFQYSKTLIPEQGSSSGFWMSRTPTPTPWDNSQTHNVPSRQCTGTNQPADPIRKTDLSVISRPMDLRAAISDLRLVLLGTNVRPPVEKESAIKSVIEKGQSRPVRKLWDVYIASPCSSDGVESRSIFYKFSFSGTFFEAKPGQRINMQVVTTISTLGSFFGNWLPTKAGFVLHWMMRFCFD